MMNRFFRHIVVITLLMIAGGFATAQQTTGQFVIKTTVSGQVHYLSHAGNVLGDATVFSPSVLWTSDNTHTQGGANKNYYFYDGENYRFLGAPAFEAGGALSLSASLPLVNQLNTPESQYYFYKWDGGLGRGVQYYGSCAASDAACTACGHVSNEKKTECWDVFWVAYIDGVWKLSANIYDLDNVPSGGSKFYSVAITEHAEETTVTSGGLSSLSDFVLEYQGEQLVTPTIANYQYTVRPAYTSYFFDDGTHNYWGNTDHGESIPDAVAHGPVSVSSYAWSISGDGASYLTISDASSATPTIRYSTPNNSGHKTATLTLTVTYNDGSTQTTSATITVKTPCQNPTVSSEVVVTYIGATVTWTQTAESYLVSWKKTAEATWTSHEVGDVSSYTITGLDYGNQVYEFKVQAVSCNTVDPAGPYYTFTTLPEPGLIVGGAIFGGGRMADVGGKTEIVVVNCDMINAIYGGNDIAGSVSHADGSTIILGVNSGDATYSDYGVTNGSFDVGSVYGGGNGYYAYNGSSFVAATGDYNSQSVAVGGHVNAMTQLHSLGDVVWTNDGTTAKTLTFPSIVKTSIRVRNNFVKVDSIFGGAKNAFLTLNSSNDNGSSIIIDGGTIFAVFGGNNFGGGQGYGKHYIEVNGTKTNLAPSIVNTDNSGYGRTFGIRYLYGGGNKVAGSTTDVHIKGGQVDELFAGGNAADIYYANVTVECSLGVDAGNHIAFGNTYTNAINHSNYTTSGEPAEGTIGTNKVNSDYAWDGLSGIYNVRTLYGGNNQAEMQRVPNITLTSGSVGTVYGGGNAGDMMGSASTTINTNSVLYGTYVELNSDKILVDYIYGGCRMSNVLNSTWVKLSKGHVGTVYGGCNISGDVGSTRIYHTYPSGGTYPTTLEEQRVRGATYVEAGTGSGDNSNLVVYKDLFAGSNGFYHCSSDGIHYNEDTKFGFPQTLYAGIEIPTHNETNVMMKEGATVKGNVYAGGNLAPVGFDDNNGFNRGYPELVGMATVLMSGGDVEKNVYGGGKMASIFGNNEVKVSGGTITKALYGGNDIAGQVAEKTNRILPSGYGYTLASDDYTSLTDMGVRTFVGVSGNAHIGTVYGGGNGDYIYDNGMIPFCGTEPSYPIQPHTFVDIHINGGASGGKINTVYGGGNGVTIRGGATVFVNIANHDPNENFDNIDTIFGGNNKGDLVVVPDIRLVHGQVGYVYGGCNRGAMRADASLTEKPKTICGYDNVGSYVRLLNEYVVVTDNSTEPPTTHTESVTAMVSKAVFGGCRMNGVTNNSLVLVEGGNFLNTPIYGGSDISGNVGGWSRVAVTGGTTGNIYGGGNGDYDYKNNNVYTTADVLIAEGSSEHPIAAPFCANSGVDILGGQVGASGNARGAFGGGYGAMTSTTGNVTVTVGPETAASWSGLPVVYGDIYGGSALGSVNTNNENLTQVNFLNGTLHGNLFGGGLGDGGDANKGKTYGKVEVNISNETQENCRIDLRDADIYGCNNTNGSPQDDVTVHVWKTAFNYSDYESGDNYTAASGADPNYAIRNVFGGGNQAGYLPANASNKALVYVHNCVNTIKRVFGGGNAAAASKVATIIEGGRMDQVFGGGNGEVSAANIGDGGIELDVTGGKIRQLFGGNNTSGEISGPMSINVTNSSPCPEMIDEFFGGSNAAAMGTVTPVNLTTTIACDPGNPVTISHVYGGSSLAPIVGNVTLTIKGGDFEEVYAGSKGADGTPATITGNTTLNLYGGEINDAFGGNNVNGNITGSITVNVLDHEECPLNVGNIYGASNATAYTPTDPASESPVINVMHVSQAAGITGNIYGGGNQGVVTANPVVNIGYYDGMDSQIPEGYQISAENRRAYVTGNVFGGGNLAGVTGNTAINMRSGTVYTGIYGGCNSSGTVSENTTVSFTGGTVGDANSCGAVYGGGLGEATKVKGNVEVTINAPSGTIYGDVYGGSAKGLVNCTADGTAQNGTSKTDVLLSAGTVNGAIYGGGHGDADHSADVWGPVTVTVNGGNVDKVFGCNNVKGQPKSTVDVVINGADVVVDEVYGGGNLAHYGGTPQVIIQNGTVTGTVFGGGNNIDGNNNGVGGGNVTMNGGTVLYGIYGGCNDDGDVTGNVTVTINGGTIGRLGSGTYGQDDYIPKILANIHGGGFGEKTKVAGYVTVNFGVDNNTHNAYPMLYGALYGGSALGSVNTSSAETTTVNVFNGTIEGNIFGGGLGKNNVPALVYGVVHVNIGKWILGGSEPTFEGAANLSKCDVYGCNNVNGSPQNNVYVDVYRTYRTERQEAGYSGDEYAINQVFGGGNRANYTPTGDQRTHVYIHGCENTAQFLYAGSNAADAYGVEIVVEGGRFREAYGGGNGLLVPANIGAGGIRRLFAGGKYGFTVDESNRWGNNNGGVVNASLLPEGEKVICTDATTEFHYFGANASEIYVDVLENTIECGSEFKYTNVYAGSRYAVIYGDVKLTVRGGYILNLFGGSQGYDELSADIRRYPTAEELAADVALPHKYSDELRAYLQEHPQRVGTGGNVTLVITGGKIGNVFGGCDINGNVEGNITVIVDDEGGVCALELGNVYGGSNRADYEPMGDALLKPNPKVEVIKGTLGMEYDFNGINGIEKSEKFEGNVFGGCNYGDVTSNPKVIVGDGNKVKPLAPVTIKGDVFGGGNEGDVNGSPKVVIVPDASYTLSTSISGSGSGTVNITHSSSTLGEDVTVDVKAIPAAGSVFTGWTVLGKGASVDKDYRASTTFTMGTANASLTAKFTAAATITFSNPENGTIEVTDSRGIAVKSGSAVISGSTLSIKAIPKEASSSTNGYVFNGWTVTGTGASVANSSSASTTFTMGSGDATLVAAIVTTANVHTLHLGNGSSADSLFWDNNNNSHPTNYNYSIAEGNSVTVSVTPKKGYSFTGWTLTGTGSTISSNTSPVITFKMGTENATLTANYIPTPVLTMKASPEGKGRLKVSSRDYLDAVMVAQGATTSIQAIPVNGYAFSGWSIAGTGASVANTSSATTNITMGTTDATLTATFVPTHTITVTLPSAEEGTITVNGNPYSSPLELAEGATLNIVATPAAGKSFDGWAKEGEGTFGDGSAASTTFTVGTSDATITATFVGE